MKGYYKNWYQHYLKLEEQKEQDIKRGYYSNLAPKEMEKARKLATKEEKKEIPPLQLTQPVKKKKKRFRFLNILFPLSILATFTFIWYQMEIEFIHNFVNEALIFARIKEPAINVASYHIDLLNQHETFLYNVEVYVSGADGLSFSELERLHQNVQNKYGFVAEIDNDEYLTVVNLWTAKMGAVEQMMGILETADDPKLAFGAFMDEQGEFLELIRISLDVGDG